MGSTYLIQIHEQMTLLLNAYSGKHAGGECRLGLPLPLFPWLRPPFVTEAAGRLQLNGVPSSGKGAEPNRPSSPSPESRLSLLAGTPLPLSPETMVESR